MGLTDPSCPDAAGGWDCGLGLRSEGGYVRTVAAGLSSPSCVPDVLSLLPLVVVENVEA